MCSDYSQREKSGRITTQNQKFHLLPDDDYLSPVILSSNTDGRNTQSDLFTNVEVQAPALDDLRAAFQAQPGESLQDKDENQTLTSWLMLPVHAKLAGLFMKGVPLN
jgi:hypothetical protein